MDNSPANIAPCSPDFMVDPFVSRLSDGVEIDGYTPNSLRALRAGWKVWRGACEAAGVAPLPASIPVLLSEIKRRVDAGQRRATIETALIFPLRAAHQRAGLASPTDSTIFRDLWRKLCRERLLARQGQAHPLKRSHLLALDKHLDPTLPRDCLMGAVCGLAYDGMLRISELAAIERAHLSPCDDGAAVLLIARSKTDQEGRGATLYIRAETMRWVNAHRRFAEVACPDGPWLFPSPYRGGHSPISTRHLTSLILAAGQRIGVDGLSGHSGRVGATQDMMHSGANLPLVQRSGRWKSAKQPARYAENAEAESSGRARFDLLRDAERKPPHRP